MFWGQTAPERAVIQGKTHLIHGSLVAPREKTGATYKVEGVVPGNMSHTCVLF